MARCLPRSARCWPFVAALLALAALAADEPDITAGALFEGRAMLGIDGAQRLMRVGESSPEGVKLISANAREAVIEFDGRRRTLVTGRDKGVGFATPERRRIAVPRGAGHQYFVPGSVNGRQVEFLVDTGANVIAMNSADARRLGIDYRARGEPGAVQTAAGVVGAWSVALDRVEVSGIVVRNVAASVIEGGYPTHVLLGMSWLARAIARPACTIPGSARRSSRRSSGRCGRPPPTSSSNLPRCCGTR